MRVVIAARATPLGGGWMGPSEEKEEKTSRRRSPPHLLYPPFLPLNPLYTDVLYISIDPGAEFGRHSARGQPTLPPPHLLPVIFGTGVILWHWPPPDRHTREKGKTGRLIPRAIKSIVALSLSIA